MNEEDLLYMYTHTPRERECVCMLWENKEKYRLLVICGFLITSCCQCTAIHNLVQILTEKYLLTVQLQLKVCQGSCLIMQFIFTKSYTTHCTNPRYFRQYQQARTQEVTHFKKKLSLFPLSGEHSSPISHPEKWAMISGLLSHLISTQEPSLVDFWSRH